MGQRKQSSGETKGKLDLLDQNLEVMKTLNFLVNPETFMVTKNYNFDVEPIAKQHNAVLGYISSNPTKMNVRLRFSDETSIPNSQNVSHCEVALDFLREASLVLPETESIPKIRFKMGTYQFEGYLIEYSYAPTNFTAGGVISKLSVEVTIISTGEDLNA